MRAAHLSRFVAGGRADGMPDVLPENHRAAGAGVGGAEIHHHRHEKRRATGSDNSSAEVWPGGRSRRKKVFRRVAVVLVILILLFIVARRSRSFIAWNDFRKIQERAGCDRLRHGDTTDESNQVPAKTQMPGEARCCCPACERNKLDIEPRRGDDSGFGGGGADSRTGISFAERASFSTNGTLTIRAGTRGTVELGLNISFTGATAESLAGQSINVATNAEKAARVTLRWKEGDEVKRESFSDGYAMRLEFGAEANNRMPGKIYLCTPDEEKSVIIAGTFNVEIRRPRPPKQNGS